MERDVHFGTTSPGPYAELIDAFVQEERNEALREPNMERREGKLAGLQACEAMRDGEIEDFDLALLVMRGTNENNHRKFGAKSISYEAYKRHQTATLAVAICYDVLRVAHYKRHGEIYGEALDKAFAEQTDRHWRPAKIDDRTVERHDSFAAKAAARHSDQAR